VAALTAVHRHVDDLLLVRLEPEGPVDDTLELLPGIQGSVGQDALDRRHHVVLEVVVEHGVQDVVLRLEIVVERPLGDADLPDDVAHGRFLAALFPEELLGRGDELLLPYFMALGHAHKEHDDVLTDSKSV